MDTKTRERLINAGLVAYREERTARAASISPTDPSYIRRFNHWNAIREAALADEALRPGGYTTGGQIVADLAQEVLDRIRPLVEVEEDEQERRNDSMAHAAFCENAYGDAAEAA